MGGGGRGLLPCPPGFRGEKREGGAEVPLLGSHSGSGGSGGGWGGGRDPVAVTTGGPSPRFCTRLPPPPSRYGPKAPLGGGGGCLGRGNWGGGGVREGQLGGGGDQEGRLGGGSPGGAIWGGAGGGGAGSRYLPLPSLWGES